MNRTIQQDYEKLLSYFSDYSLKNIVQDTTFQNNVKSIHRKLYAYLVFASEAKNNHLFSSDTITNYYDEVGSDLILSYLCFAGQMEHINLLNFSYGVLLKTLQKQFYIQNGMMSSFVKMFLK